MNPRIDEARFRLLSVYHDAVARVSGRRLVANHLDHNPFASHCHVLAIGKAAVAMCHGVLDSGMAVQSGLVVYPDQQCPAAIAPSIECHAAQHPLPGPGSFAAGERALEFLAGLPDAAPLLVLLSGGGSSLMEAPWEGVSEQDVAAVHDWLLSSGLDIVDVNRIRQSLSRVKGGGLARHMGARPCRVLALSDVPPGYPSALASGPFLPALGGELPIVPDWISVLLGKEAPPDTPEIDHVVVADSGTLAAVAAELGGVFHLPVHAGHGWVEGDAADMGRSLAQTLRDAEPGFWVWTGETTITLPSVPGRGGRCQQLALAAAECLAGQDDCLLLACGSDGLDGPEGDAGAIVDGETLERGRAAGLCAEDALDWADAGRFLAAAGDLVNTGPSDTNVNDLIIGVKLPR